MTAAAVPAFTLDVRVELKRVNGLWYYTLYVGKYADTGETSARKTAAFTSFPNLKDALAAATQAALHLADETSAGNLVPRP